MKEKGIIFSTPMVRALQDGKKTQDRRIVQLTDSGLVTNGKLRFHPHDINAWMCCPYGRIGDRLWVKESYADMPRKLSRITLEITGVRVERLRDISEEGARAEGIIDGGCLNCGKPEPCQCPAPNPSARESFIH